MDDLKAYASLKEKLQKLIGIILKFSNEMQVKSKSDMYRCLKSQYNHVGRAPW